MEGCRLILFIQQRLGINWMRHQPRQECCLSHSTIASHHYTKGEVGLLLVTRNAGTFHEAVMAVTLGLRLLLFQFPGTAGHAEQMRLHAVL